MPDVSIISAGLGLLVGLVLALTGAGGAILAIPLLIFALHLSVPQAAPIALLAIFVASSMGALQGLLGGIVRYKTALLIAAFGLAFAPVGVALSRYVPLQWLNVTLALVLVFVAVRIWQQSADNASSNEDKPAPACALNPATSKLFWTAPCTKRLVLTGSLTGLLSGLLGVGGGFVIVPSLNKVSNFSAPTIVATTLAVVALVSAGSLVMHMQGSPVLWSIALPFTAGTTLGMLILGRWRHHVPSHISQRGFALLCLLAAVYLTLKSL